MIEIKPVALEQLNTFRMQVTEKTEVLGAVDVYLQDQCAFLSNLDTGVLDSALLYGLGKAALNLADLRGAKEAFCSDATMESFLTPLRFKKTDEATWKVSLEHYFEVGCHA